MIQPNPELIEIIVNFFHDKTRNGLVLSDFFLVL